MRSIRAVNIFLFFTFIALVFVSLFPSYFPGDSNKSRPVSFFEGILSLLFVLLWLAFSAFTAGKKRRDWLFGAIAFSLMAYIPSWFLPLFEGASKSGTNNLFLSIGKSIFAWMQVIAGAPLTGVSMLFSQDSTTGLSGWMLPVLLLIYGGTQLFRFYRQAYQAEQLRLDDSTKFSNPELAKALGARTPNSDNH